jgi:hypothetical protein
MVPWCIDSLFARRGESALVRSFGCHKRSVDFVDTPQHIRTLCQREGTRDQMPIAAKKESYQLSCIPARADCQLVCKLAESMQAC